MGKNRISKKKRDLFRGLVEPRHEADRQYLRDNPNPRNIISERAGQEAPGEDEEMANALSGNDGVDDANEEEVSCVYHCLDHRFSHTTQ